MGRSRSLADETKKVAYLGAAVPYFLFGVDVKTVVGAATLVAVATTWFIICQTVAHLIIAATNQRKEESDG